LITLHTSLSGETQKKLLGTSRYHRQPVCMSCYPLDLCASTALEFVYETLTAKNPQSPLCGTYLLHSRETGFSEHRLAKTNINLSDRAAIRLRRRPPAMATTRNGTCVQFTTIAKATGIYTQATLRKSMELIKSAAAMTSPRST
jgi:hypothetical protein